MLTVVAATGEAAFNYRWFTGSYKCSHIQVHINVVIYRFIEFFLSILYTVICVAKNSFIHTLIFTVYSQFMKLSSMLDYIKLDKVLYINSLICLIRVSCVNIVKSLPHDVKCRETTWRHKEPFDYFSVCFYQIELNVKIMLSWIRVCGRRMRRNVIFLHVRLRLCLRILLLKDDVSTAPLRSSAHLVSPLWKLLFWVTALKASLLPLPLLLLLPPPPPPPLTYSVSPPPEPSLARHIFPSPPSFFLLLKCNPRPCLIDGGMMKVAGGGMVVPCFLLRWWRRSCLCLVSPPRSSSPGFF